MPRKSSQLSEYRRKRDFRKTAEPAGAPAAPQRAGHLAFVIQKHAASHLHYDLRLELDGVMKSWAVPKGPSLNPAHKRLAMQVEDHPVEYNTFEGTIPRGEYGGGTVMVWDRGTYRPDEPMQGESDADAVRRGLRAGKLSFTFHGERLRGSFALVRTDGGPKPKWLLLKHRDADAAAGREITEEVLTSVATGRTMDEIAAERDRVWRSNRDGGEGGEEPADAPGTPDAGDVFVPMPPAPATGLPADGDWTFQPWRGGVHVLAFVTADAAHLIDASGRDVAGRHADIARELVSLAARTGRHFVLDGELADDDGGEPAFFASDILLDGDRPLMPEPWRERRAALQSLLRRRRLDRIRRPEPVTDGAALLRRVSRAGLPGILARRLDGAYTPGARTDALIRIPAPRRDA